jgi:hypothetical protein
MKTFVGLFGVILSFGWSGVTLPAVQAQSGLARSPLHASLKTPSARRTLAPDINVKALWDGRKEVAFHASTRPKVVPAAEAHFMVDEEYVLGITKNGESRAYPTRFVSWHHIVNDRIGSVENGASSFITVTYCIVCNSGLCFEAPTIDNKPLQFDFYGLYNGVMTLFDKDTESVWLQVSGRAVKGPLCDTTLKRTPLLDTTWGEWKKLHPHTLVMAPDPRFTASYESKGSIMVRGYTEFPASYFRPTLTHQDARLPMFDSVLAVSLPATDTGAANESVAAPRPQPALHRAYPMKLFKKRTGVVNDSLGTTPVAVLFKADTQTMHAVCPVVEGRTLTLEVRKSMPGKVAFYDRETGTRWNIEGHAEAGPLVGKDLQRIDSHLSQWYGWVAYFPETSIYGQAGSPKHSVPRSSVSNVGQR